MTLNLPAGLFEHLRARQAARGYRDDVSQRLHAVWLHTDMGRSFYLTADGRILADDVVTGAQVHEIGAPEIYLALVAGAKTISAPELLSLLPRPCDGAVPCNRCGGERRIEFGRDIATGMTGEIICPTCEGLGWKSGELTVDVVAPGFVSSEEARPNRDWALVAAEGFDVPLQFCRS